MSKNKVKGNNGNSEKAGFGTYASLRIVIGIVVVMGCLWLGAAGIAFFTEGENGKSKYRETVEQYPLMEKADGMIHGFAAGDEHGESEGEKKMKSSEALDMVQDKIENPGLESGYFHSQFLGEHESASIDTRDVPTAVHPVEEPASGGHGAEGEAAEGHGSGGHEASAPTKVMTRKVIGVAFVEALVEPLESELHSFWGWRPNDLWITKLGRDNAENYQLGVREITRRSADILAERIARTGSNVSYNKYLNDAVNSLTVDPGSYWWPSAEREYQRAIDNLRKYKEQLARGEESFYTRPDNLIPLLIEYRTRLGDCDNKLVRLEGVPATQVSTFEADDRFYYAKGLAAAMLPVLEAIQEDFYLSLKTRDGIETLHHAIESCKGAAHMSPWIVLEGNYNGFLANHRANMSTYISHARFYIGVLITTLST